MAVGLRGLTPLLSVYDMPASVRFYRDLLGFEVVSTSPRIREDYWHWAMLRSDDVVIMLNTGWEFDEERPPERPPREGVCLYIGCPDVDAAYRDLTAKGVRTQGEPKVARYGMKQLYFQDPDGYLLCYQWPTA